MRARLATLILAAGVSLGGCAYGPGLNSGVSVGAGYGDPYGGGYSPYARYGNYGGYGGYGGYGDPYGRYNPYYRSPYYGSPYGYYGSPYMGWYDNYYYPGSGYYVYDRDRNRRRINEAERRRWLQGIAEAAARAGRDEQSTSGGSATTQRVAPSSGRQRVIRNRDLSTQIRSRAEARQTERRATSRSSNDLRTVIRRRADSSND